SPEAEAALSVEDGRPVIAAISRLPQPTCRGGNIDDLRVAFDDVHINDASAHVARADAACREGIEEACRPRDRFGSVKWRRRQKKNDNSSRHTANHDPTSGC